MHFVGSIENWANSWDELLDILASKEVDRSGASPNTLPRWATKLRSRVVRREGANKRKTSADYNGEIRAKIEHLRSIEKLYDADFTCFGYSRRSGSPPVYSESDYVPVNAAAFNWRDAPWVKHGAHIKTAAFKGITDGELVPTRLAM
jgi:hypothetical protein